MNDPFGPSDTSADTATARVATTDPEIIPAFDLGPYLSVGDWIRIGSSGGFVCSVVALKPTFPFTVRLNQP
jgi:hypothetical protein